MKEKSTARKSRTDWNRLRAMRDDAIDCSDIPEIKPDLLKTMVVRMPERKTSLSLRLDPVVVEWFRKQGPGYQTRMNAVLKAYVDTQKPAHA
jgi:uncharacterized protein (DUF4415 family)